MKLISDEKGQSLVEMALVLPILLLVLLGIMEGGRIFAGYLELEHSARDGARQASVHTTLTESEVKTYIKSRISFLDENKLDVPNPDGTAPFTFSRTTTGSGSNVVRLVTVNLRYPLEITTPIISNITNNPFYLETSMVMRSE